MQFDADGRALLFAQSSVHPNGGDSGKPERNGSRATIGKLKCAAQDDRVIGGEFSRQLKMDRGVVELMDRIVANSGAWLKPDDIPIGNGSGQESAGNCYKVR